MGDEDLCLQLSLRQKKQTHKNVCFQHNKLKIFPLWIIFPLQNRGHKIREMPTMKKTKTIFLVIYFLMSCFLSSKGNLQKFTKNFYIELNLPTKPPPKCKSRSLESTFNLSKKFETSLKPPFYYIQKRLKPFGLFSTFPPSKKKHLP